MIRMPAIYYSRSFQILGSLFLALSVTFSPDAFAQESSPEYVPGEIIVKLRGSAKSMESQAFIGKAVSQKSMNLKGTWSGLNMHHFALKPGQDIHGVIAELKADPDVLYAEPNYIVRNQSAGPTGSSVSMAEVHASSDVGAFAVTSAPIDLNDGWVAASPGLDAPIVAVIDTGLDLDHSVFTSTGALWTNTNEVLNGIDDDGNGFIDDIHGWNFVANNNNPRDDNGHGTHVAGIVLGATQDITKIVLQPAKVRVMPLKFLDSTGSGTTSDAIKAIYYAVNNGAKILNNSWGGGGYSNALLEAISYAYNKRVVFVAAAGNAANNNDHAPTYPANYSVPNMISIAATSDIDGLAGFSNYGAQTVHMGAPGVSIWSTLPGNMFGMYSGTSMATPFVAGVASLMVRESPDLNGYQVKSLIFGGAEPVASLQAKTVTRSRLNVYNAVVAAKSTSVDPNDQPSYSFSASGRELATIDGGGAGGCGLVGKVMMDSSGGGSGGSGGSTLPRNIAFFVLLVVMVAPIAMSLMLRRQEGRNKRRHTRYHLNSEVRLMVGDRELVGSVSTISLGGVQLNTDAWLENGGIVKMSIRSPDGKDEIEVEGQIVWSEEKKRYGVAFANANAPVRNIISRWTEGLMKA